MPVHWIYSTFLILFALAPNLALRNYPENEGRIISLHSSLQLNLNFIAEASLRLGAGCPQRCLAWIMDKSGETGKKRGKCSLLYLICKDSLLSSAIFNFAHFGHKRRKFLSASVATNYRCSHGKVYEAARNQKRAFLFPQSFTQYTLRVIWYIYTQYDYVCICMHI